jgi:hypothetical protein
VAIRAALAEEVLGAAIEEATRAMESFGCHYPFAWRCETLAMFRLGVHFLRDLLQMNRAYQGNLSLNDACWEALDPLPMNVEEAVGLLAEMAGAGFSGLLPLTNAPHGRNPSNWIAAIKPSILSVCCIELWNDFVRNHRYVSCQRCGRPIIDRRAGSKYCTTECAHAAAQAAYRARMKRRSGAMT